MHIRRTGILTKVVLLVLLVYAILTLVSLRDQVERAEQQRDQLEQKVADVAAENDDIRYAVEHSDDDDVIRDIARDKLSLVEPGEEVYYAS